MSPFPGNTNRRAASRLQADRSLAFTLVEVMVVLFLLLLLTSIALPTFKNLLIDQKASRCARGVIAFFDVARNRAIAENRPVGVRIERLASPGGTDPFGRATSIRLRQLIGIPPYTGDASDAVALLMDDPLTLAPETWIGQAEFSAQDSPLLWLSSNLLNNASSTDDHLAPIRIGDHLELPGGRSVPIDTITHTAASGSIPEKVTVTFDLQEKLGTVSTFRGTFREPNLAAGDPVKYRIHRRPVPSSTQTYDLLPGMAIDLNFSGVGIDNNDFHPDMTATVTADHIDIVFAPDGSVQSVTNNMATGTFGPPMSLMYLCLGTVDGVIPYDFQDGDLFQADSRVTSNLMSLNSIWLKLNPSTGRMVASPFASVATVPPPSSPPIPTPNPRTDLDESAVMTALSEARSLAQESATLDSEP